MKGKRSKGEEWRRQVRLESLEAEIAALEAKLGTLAEKLATPSDDHTEIQRQGEAYVRYKEALDKLLVEWEALSAQP